jgi:hypothetical protein
MLQVNLFTDTAEALDRAAGFTDLDHEDVVNRAIDLYERIVAGLLLGDERLRYTDERNRSVDLVLPAGQERYLAVIARQNNAAYFWRWTAYGVTAASLLAITAIGILIFAVR